MTTNLTNLTTAETFYELSLFVNQESNNVFFLLFTIVFFIIVFMALKRYDTIDALWVSSFLTFLITLFFSSINLVATIYILPYLFMFIIIGLYVYLTRSTG